MFARYCLLTSMLLAAMSLGVEVTGSQQLIDMLNAAIIRVQQTPLYDTILEQTAANSPPNIDVKTFFKQDNSSVESMPFPMKSELTGIAKTVINTGLIYTCEFAPFPANASANRERVLFEAYLPLISAYYGTDVKPNYLFVDPTQANHFDYLVSGRSQGGCDVDIAGAAMGGFYNNKPRTTGPLGQFLATIPTQSQAFNVLVGDSNPYKTWSALKLNAAKLTICIGFVNGLMTQAYFRTGTIKAQYFNEDSICKKMVLNSPDNTIYFTSYLTVTSPAITGLTKVYAGVVAACAIYVNPEPNAEVVPLMN